MIARVSLEIALRKEFDYLIPAGLVGQVDVGSRVQVPFGARKVMGCVTALAEESGFAKLKPILKVIGAQTLVTPRVLELARWIADYYCCAPEAALKSVLPEAVRREKTGWRERLFVRALPAKGDLPKLPKRQQEVWNIVEERRELPLTELLELVKTTASTVRRLEDRGLVEIATQISERDPYAREHILPSQPLPLNPAQEAALEAITKAMDNVGGTGVSPVVSGVPPETVAGGKALSVSTNQRQSVSHDEVRRDAELDPRDAGATTLISEATARRRRLPHFEIPGSTYHVTWRTRGNLKLSPEACQKTLDACIHWHARKMKCYIACVMPDHVHLLLQPLPLQAQGKTGVHSLTEILHSIKSFSAHAANKAMKRNGPLWQDESFDRMIRSESDLHEKWNYIWNNPRELGLVGPMEEYPFIWTPPGGTGVSPVVSGVPPETVAGGRALPFSANQRQSASHDEVRRDAELDPRDAGATNKNAARTTFLLHGVTGSGKTEVYLQAIAARAGAGQGAIVLVPEISLTPQTVERFKSRRFGPNADAVAVLHSHLSDGERHDEWHRIRQGRARIVIGARSAHLRAGRTAGPDRRGRGARAHLQAGGGAALPRARRGRGARRRCEGAVVVLGRATPSLESFHNCAQGQVHAAGAARARGQPKDAAACAWWTCGRRARGGKAADVLASSSSEAIDAAARDAASRPSCSSTAAATPPRCMSAGAATSRVPELQRALTYHRARSNELLLPHLRLHEPRAGGLSDQSAGTRHPVRRHRHAAGRGRSLSKLFPQARVAAAWTPTSMQRKDDLPAILGDFRDRQDRHPDRHADDRQGAAFPERDAGRA